MRRRTTSSTPGVEERIVSPPQSARRRGRTGLFDRLLNFEHANMSEILDIRQELPAPQVPTGHSSDHPRTLIPLPKTPIWTRESTRLGLPLSRCTSWIEATIEHNSSLREKSAEWLQILQLSPAWSAGRAGNRRQLRLRSLQHWH